MFTERYRSHHDAEGRLAAMLKNGGSGKARSGGGGLQSFRSKSAPLARRLFRIGKAMGLKPPAGNWKALERVLRETPVQKTAGIYLHVPYCDKICSFCNLNRTSCGGVSLDSYANYLISEIKEWGRYPYIQGQRFESVYLGGGTPTVLSASQLGDILAALKDNIPLAKNCEISVESTQHNLNREKAAALQKAGVNRLSIGIQTFSERGRRLLGRTFSEERAKEELRTLRETFGGVLGIDIIYSYPDQSLEELRHDAEMCVSSGIDSVSFYSLMIQKGSALSSEIEEQRLAFNRNIAFDLERHNLFYNTLREAGFSLLELSKLARPGKDNYRYIHIQYGEGDLVPIGQGAGGNVAGFPLYSLAPGRRMTGKPDPLYQKYHRILGLLQFGVYDPERICAGLSVAQKEAAASAMKLLADTGFLSPAPDGKNQVLSADGIFWGNNIAVAILENIIKVNEKTKRNET
jgi:oxygen-independent coproporphyrinogen-3 oxidase